MATCAEEPLCDVPEQWARGHVPEERNSASEPDRRVRSGAVKLALSTLLRSSRDLVIYNHFGLSLYSDHATHFELSCLRSFAAPWSPPFPQFDFESDAFIVRATGGYVCILFLQEYILRVCPAQRKASRPDIHHEKLLDTVQSHNVGSVSLRSRALATGGAVS